MLLIIPTFSYHQALYETCTSQLKIEKSWKHIYHRNTQLRFNMFHFQPPFGMIPFRIHNLDISTSCKETYDDKSYEFIFSI
jgi:hypothetical protein